MEKSEEMLSINNFFDNDQLNEVKVKLDEKIKLSTISPFFILEWQWRFSGFGI